MLVDAASVPADHPAMEPIQVYTSALANPAIDVSTVRSQAIEAFGGSDWSPSPAPRDSGGFADPTYSAPEPYSGQGKRGRFTPSSSRAD